MILPQTPIQVGHSERCRAFNAPDSQAEQYARLYTGDLKEPQNTKGLKAVAPMGNPFGGNRITLRQPLELRQ